MKTYSTKSRTQRLAAFLVANGKPFCFDGCAIEFTASEEFVEEMRAGDEYLAAISFTIL